MIYVLDPRAQRSVRDLLRRRFGLVRMATRLLLSVQSAWTRHTGQCLSVNAFRQLAGSAIEVALPDPIVRLSVRTQIEVWQEIQQQVQQVKRWVIASTSTALSDKSMPVAPGRNWGWRKPTV